MYPYRLIAVQIHLSGQVPKNHRLCRANPSFVLWDEKPNITGQQRIMRIDYNRLKWVLKRTMDN